MRLVLVISGCILLPPSRMPLAPKGGDRWVLTPDPEPCLEFSLDGFCIRRQLEASCTGRIRKAFIINTIRDREPSLLPEYTKPAG